jgi:hypothetical protein
LRPESEVTEELLTPVSLRHVEAYRCRTSRKLAVAIEADQFLFPIAAISVLTEVPVT